MYKYFKELDYLDKYKTHLVDRNNSDVEYIWPNSWFITPSGYLYNSGGLSGHKNG